MAFFVYNIALHTLYHGDLILIKTADNRAEPMLLVQPRTNFLTYLALAAIMFFSGAGSVYWIQHNVVPLGHDTAGHLERTLDIAHLLARPSWQTLFQVITFHDLRPPIMYILAQPFYWLFGYNAHSATFANVALLALILWLTFDFGRRWANARVGLFAALLTALFPMLAAMSRLFYLDNIVAALVLINLLALLRCENFARRGWSLLWGVSLGMGMLAKWPYPIHILLPTLFVLWRAHFFQAQWLALRKLQVDWRKLGLALLVAIILVAIWYLPNRTYAHKQKMILGDLLIPIWLVFLTPLLYTLLRPQSLLTNVWASVLLAGTIASLWYAPRIDFMNYLADAALGTYGGNYQAADPLRLYNYVRYWDYLRLNHLGLLATEQAAYALARDYYQQSMQIRRTIGDQPGLAGGLYNLGWVAQRQNDYAAAARFYEQSLEIGQTLGIKDLALLNLSNLAIVQSNLQQGTSAQQYFQASLALAVELGAVPLQLIVLTAAIELALASGQPQQAAQWAGLLLHHPQRNQDLVRDVERLQPRLLAALGNEFLAEALAQGSQLDINAVITDLLEHPIGG